MLPKIIYKSSGRLVDEFFAAYTSNQNETASGGSPTRKVDAILK